MTHQRHADSIRQFAINKVIRKAFQVRAVETRFDRLKSPGLCCGHGDHPAQLRVELFTQPLRHRVVTSQGFCYILLDGGVVLDSHRLLPASTRLQNSASESGWTWPLSISCSRRSTSASSSASDHTSPAGGSEFNNDSASTTRCSTGKASTVFSISSITDMPKGYAVSYTHLRAHETRHDLVCRLLLEKKKKKSTT